MDAWDFEYIGINAADTDQSYQNGYKNGYDNGYSEGYERAKRESQETLNTLMRKQRELVSDQIMCCATAPGGMRALIERFCLDKKFIEVYDWL